MFKDLLIQWVAELCDKFTAVGQSGYLAINIGSFNATLYSYIKTIMETVAMPVAYVILALFFVLELYNMSVRVDGAGGGTSFGAEMVFKVMFRMVLCKIAVDSSLLFMEAIYSVGQTLISGISSIISTGSVNGIIDMTAMTAEINSLELGGQIGMLLDLVIVRLGVWVAFGLAEIICAARFIELYVFIAISPIPLATFPSAELSQVAKSFLKSFAVIILQGVFIYLILSFFPVLVNANILGDTGIGVWSMLLYCILLVLGVFSAKGWAKSICSVM